MSQAAGRHYEVMVITTPELADKADEFIMPYRKRIEGTGGAITRYENWGRRALAYPIDKHTKASYLLMNFSTANETIVEEMEKDMNASVPILRCLLSRTKEPISKPSPEAKKKAQQLAEKAMVKVS